MTFRPPIFLTLPQILAQPPKPLLNALISAPSFQSPSHSLKVIFAQPPAPFSGLSSILPPSGSRIDISGVYAEFKNAILALSDRLSEDKWFLGSRLVRSFLTRRRSLIGPQQANSVGCPPICICAFYPLIPTPHPARSHPAPKSCSMAPPCPPRHPAVFHCPLEYFLGVMQDHEHVYIPKR